MVKITFEKYLKEPFALDFEKMQALHGDLLDELGNDPDAWELYEELVDAATRYAGIRAGWLRLPQEEKLRTDGERTSAHNYLSIRFNMMARYLRMQGKQALWRDALGDDEENGYLRKPIGDFGCYIAFVYSINAR